MSQKPKNVGKKAQVAVTCAFALDPEDGGQRRSLTSVKDGGTLTKWANVAKFTIDTLEQGIEDSKNVGDSSLQTKLEEALAGFQELMDHYDNFEFLRGPLTKKGYDFSDAFQACEEQLNQDRRRFAETLEQSRNVSQGAAPAGVPSVAGVQAVVAGDGASYEDMMKKLALKTAELKFEKDKEMAELELQQKKNTSKLEVRQKELEVQQKKDTVETQGQLNKFKLRLTKVGATADEALESSKNANERLNLTATKKDLQSLREEMLRSREGDGMKEDGGEDGDLVGAVLDFSDSSSDDESASSPRRAGVNAVTPMDKKTVKVSRETYDAFSSLLNRAVEYGQEGKETEMNACLKKAEDFMAKTDLAEERQRFHQRFKTGSSCARRLCSQYGLKPAAR